MKTAVTALVSAVIGGLVTAVFLLAAFFWIGEDANEALRGGGEAPPASEEGPTSGTDTGAGSGGGMDGMSASVREVYAEDGPGVVSVDVRSALGPGGGSGFVVDERGHIVTNQHVVEGAEDVSVRFASGVREAAEVVGEDPSTDVAVLKVEAPRGLLVPLTLGDSESVGVGDPVIAIGNPLNVGISVTTGIVSGTDRSIEAPNDFTIDGAVQTDAAINPGNSGGPLLDAGGSVIGVNAQIASGSGGFEGLGFAVPINTVKDVVRQLIETGEAEHGFIGVSMSEAGVDELSGLTGLTKGELEERFGFPPNGAIVGEAVRGGPAWEAGIRGGESREVEGIPVTVGDVITTVEGEPVASPDDVIAAVNGKRPGERISMTVVTPDEEPREVTFRVGDQPDGA